MKRLLLVDGHSVIYRSFYAFIRQPLRNSEGFNTSAVYGFAQMLGKLWRGGAPDFCAVAFDTPGETFRHRQFGDYKVHRPPPPEELPPQIPIVEELVAAWGVRSFAIPGVEADDVLATLAVAGAAAGLEVTVVTTDKDLLQLVGGNVTVLDPWKELRYGPDQVRERLGVAPSQVPDLLALMGDSSDNIPGVPGIGPKRAKAILDRLGTLERAIVEDERVRAHVDAARMSLELATVKTDVELAVGLPELAPVAQDTDKLAELYRRMNFRSMLAGLEDMPGPELEPDPNDDGQMAGSRIQSAEPAQVTKDVVLAFDREDGLWYLADGQEARHLPVTEREAIAAVLGREGVTRVGFEMKPQFKALADSGLALEPPWFDIEIGAWMADPNRGRYPLQSLGGVEPSTFAERLSAIARLWAGLETQVAALGLGQAAREIEMPLIPVLARMERRGIRVDPAQLDALEREFTTEVESVAARVRELAGVEFNLDSPKQLGEVLFVKLGLPKGRKTQTGFSTDSAVLEKLAERHPIVRELVRYRELTKLCRTYVGPLKRARNPETGRIYATFDQTGTATGRLSSLDPNLQNIPTRTPEGQRLRQAFTCDEGNVLISADYSQIELRVLAHLSNDEALIEAFGRGEDIHRWTAAAVLGIAPADVTSEHRRLAKVINYGLVYGMGERNLAAEAGIAVEEARAFLDAYLARFTGVARWRDRVVEQAKAEGVVRMISGRIRPVPGVVERNRAVAEASKRAAVNAPVQGSAADIVKVAMLRVDERLDKAGLGPGMILQVHDELLFEVRAADAGQTLALVKEEMEGAWRLCVPLVVDARVGRSWAEVH